MFLNNKFIFLSLLTVSFSFAQEKLAMDTIKKQNLNEVIVTATRTERQLSSLPLPVQVISKEQIKQSGSLRLNDILDEQTGLLIVPDFGGVLGIQMQGLDAQYTLILIDGVPLIGRSAGTLDLSRITVNNIKQIEIVKGPSSSLYGSEAIGGVINIITDVPKNTKLKGTASYRLGSFENQDANFNLGFASKKWNLNASLNGFSTKGYDLDKTTKAKTVLPYQNITPQLQLNYKFSDKLNLTTSTRYFAQNGDLEAIVDSEKASGESVTNEYNSHTRLFHNPNKALSFTYEFYATQYHVNQELRFDNDNSLLENSYYKEKLMRPEIRTSFKKRNTTYTSGIGYGFNNLDRTYFAEKVDYNSYYAFLQYDYNINQKWNVLAGARYDKNEAYASAFSPKLALNYNLNKQFSLQGSIGYGFKAPDLRQLYFDFENPSVGYIVLGYNVATARLAELEAQDRIENLMIRDDFFDNPLSPETSVGYNFGIKHNIEKLKTNLNVFYNNVENLIDNKVIARLRNGQNVFSYTNIGSVFTEGLELNSSFQINANFQISGGYQFLIAKDNDVIDEIKRGEKFARDENGVSFRLKEKDYFGLFNRSKHMLNIKYFLKIPSLNLSHNLRATYRSKYGLLDTNDNQILDNYDKFAKEYVIFDTSFTKKIGAKFEIQAGVDNILNFTDTQNASNFSGRLWYCKAQYNF